jgi:hypothetical protein
MTELLQVTGHAELTDTLIYGEVKHIRGFGNMEKPYTNLDEENGVLIREFSQTLDPIELKWHRDDETREIISENRTDWMIQLDNALPVSLNNNVRIPRHEWHRLIKGTGTLTLKIKKEPV